MTSVADGTQQTKKKPGAVGFWIGGLLIVAGIAAGIIGVVTGVKGLTDTVDGYQRVSLATGGTVELGEGTHRVFFEAPGADEDFGPGPGGFTITAPDGSMVPLTGDSVSETYTFSERDGRKLGKISAPVAGTYEVRPITSDGGSGTPGTLAFGRKGPTSSIVPILVGVFGGIGIGLIGVIVLIVTGVRRGRARRSGGHPGGPPPGYGAPAWGASPTGAGGWAPPPSGPGGAPGWAPPPGSPPPPPGSWTPPPPGSWTPPSGPVS